MAQCKNTLFLALISRITSCPTPIKVLSARVLLHVLYLGSSFTNSNSIDNTFDNVVVILQIKISYEDLRTSILWLSVWNWKVSGRNSFLGEFCHPLSDMDLTDSESKEVELRKKVIAMYVKHDITIEKQSELQYICISSVKLFRVKSLPSPQFFFYFVFFITVGYQLSEHFETEGLSDSEMY